MVLFCADRPSRWDWGCSHSLDVRITHNGSTWAPICTSDTCPGAGIWFNNRVGDDFATYANGDVGWAWADDGASALQIARVSRCE